jgi:hypothetical protein
VFLEGARESFERSDPTTKGGSMRNKAPRALRPSVTALAVGLGTLVVMAGAAYAGIAALAASEVITACKSEASGQVRIVDDASQCKGQEVAITWNTEGPTGPAGPVGPAGPPGPGGGGLSKLEYVTAGPDLASQQAVEAVCSSDLHVVGGAVRNRAIPGNVRASHPSDGSGSGQPGSRGWYGLVAGGSGPFRVVAICAPAGSTEFRSAGGQYGGQYGG